MTIRKNSFLIFTFLFAYSVSYGLSNDKAGEPRSIYNILDYGAVGDGINLNTKAIQLAIDACADSGGGTVVIPSGIYLSGTIVLKDNICLHFEHNATLLGSTRHKDYPLLPPPMYRSHKDRAGGFYALIYAERAQNIALTGHGTINGQGKDQKPRPNPVAGDIDGRPRNILFISCKNIRVEGLHLINSGVWNQHYLNCEDVVVDKISVYNHVNRNNDAIDIDGCRRFILSNSIFDSDDDGITLKSTGAAASEDITITNCIISSWCNAIKAGTESTGGFKNITISNCIIKPSRSKEKPIFNDYPSGITGISLEIVDGGTMEGVTINNITIDGTMCPLYIRLGNRARKHTDGVPEPGMGTMKNITISNLIAYNTGNYSSSITSIPGYYIENVSLNNIQFFNKGGLQKGDFIETIDGVKEDEKGYPQPTVWENLPSSVLFLRHAKNVMINGLIAGSNSDDPRIPVIAHDVEGLSIKNSRITKGNTAYSFFLGKDVKAFEVEKPLGWKRQVVQSLIKFDDISKTKWNKDFELVEINSTMDDTIQKAYFYKSKSNEPKPLIVSLHTWSGDYSQNDDLAVICKQKGLNYIHPNFRGANWTKNACCSELALSDIDDAITYAIKNSNVDTSKIYVIGVSGGGYATLSTFMKSKHNIKKFSAWASISDLITWYNDSEIRNSNYAKNILDCTSSKSDLNIANAKQKSPMYWDTPTGKLTNSKLFIYAGIYDGIQGSVPITHSINFYNKLLTELSISDTSKYVSVDEKLKLLEFRKPLGNFGSIAGRKIYLKKKFGNLSLIIFKGNHEMLTEFALNELLEE